MTTCNLCCLNRIRSEATAKGKVYTVKPCLTGSLGGWDIYVHPKQVNITLLMEVDPKYVKHYWVSWLMEIPESCQC